MSVPDFNPTSELGVTIAGQLFVRLLCVFVLPVVQLALGDGLPVEVVGRGVPS